MKQQILVTGANGQLGKELQVISSRFPQYDFHALSREDLSIHNPEAVRELFTKQHFDYCINCAAYTAVDKAEEEKELAFLVNGHAPGHLAAVCRENHVSFLHVSTDYVFDGTGNTPYKEDDPTNPQGVYAASKLEGERLIQANNPDAIIIRTSWVYSEFGKNFVKTMIRLMSDRERIGVVNDQYGSPTYAADLAAAIMQIVKEGAWTKANGRAGIFHFSNDGTITWYTFAVAIKSLIGSSCEVNPITSAEFPTPVKRPAYSVLDKQKIQTVFGIQLEDWKQSLAVCIHRLMNN